uniref:phosphatidylinositol-3,4,5-trisphosphate 3-phosphatase n=1 Tax=Syphacia muris TaxID=451379 RepID=A0A0N5AC69_9BILA
MNIIQTPTTSTSGNKLKNSADVSTGDCCDGCSEEKLDEEGKRKKSEVELITYNEKSEEEFLNRPYRSRGSRKLLEKSFRPLRQLVSQNRRRFREDGFDLDLTYITDRVIAMGYPSGGHEWFYRNPMSATVAFLEHRHKDHYMVFNLRGYYNYDTRNFDNRVLYFEMNDHHPPRLEQISRICRRAHEYLLEDLRNVIVFHCKAGKGRTGVMICAYLIYINFYPSPRQVLDYYGIVRTVNNKVSF